MLTLFQKWLIKLKVGMTMVTQSIDRDHFSIVRFLPILPHQISNSLSYEKKG